MKKIRNMFQGIRDFIHEVQVELKKCAWPTRPELMQSTVVVVVSVFILSAFVGLSDTVLMWLSGLIIG